MFTFVLLRSHKAIQPIGRILRRFCKRYRIADNTVSDQAGLARLDFSTTWKFTVRQDYYIEDYSVIIYANYIA